MKLKGMHGKNAIKQKNATILDKLSYNYKSMPNFDLLVKHLMERNNTQ